MSSRRPLTAWEVAAAPPGTPRHDVAGWRPTTVPTTAAGALRDAGAWGWDEPRGFDREDWWWRCAFEAAPAGRAVLGLDGLATLAEVWLDDELVLTSDSMFARHELDVTGRLRGRHALTIRCRALAPELAARKGRPRWKVPMLEHQQLRLVRTTLLGRTPGWSPPAPAVGPWRPVWLEEGPGRAPRPLVRRASLDGEDGRVEVAVRLDAPPDAAALVVRDPDGREVARAPLAPASGPGDARWAATAAVAAPRRWWPHTHGAPARYGLAVEVRHGDDLARHDLGAVGFRALEVDRAGGAFAVRVNGVPVFCRGALWTPLDAVTLRHTPAEVDAAIAQVRAAGMNMLRVPGTTIYEDDAFYDALDAHGVLLWQDLMFANMDYPEDDAFAARAVAEATAELDRLAHRPCLAVVCGNSEGDQQAAMWGAPRARWAPALFHEVLPAVVAARCPGVAYVPSSATGGAFPHAADEGPSSYYGVGAYLRPLEDARRADVRFASECLAFANLPAAGSAGDLGVTARARARVPRDLGAGWDFEDVRDHYVAARFGVDPIRLRATDPARYLALGRATTGEVMAAAFAEWRRPASRCGGALILQLRDLWPGAGWGVLDDAGAPKPAWYALRRALAPTALAITDEGTNGLALHVAHDGAAPLDAEVEVALYRAGELRVGHATAPVRLPAHGARTIAAASLFDHWLDLSYAHRFGPPVAELVHATLRVGGAVVAEAFHHPAGMPAVELDLGLTARARPAVPGDDGPGDAGGAYDLTVTARRFALGVHLDAPRWAPSDDHFHLAPGQARTIRLRPLGASGPPRAALAALNAHRVVPVEVAP